MASRVKFPDTEDLNGAAVALLRLQDTYQISPGEIAEGRIRGIAASESLTGTLCVEHM